MKVLQLFVRFHNSPKIKIGKFPSRLQCYTILFRNVKMYVNPLAMNTCNNHVNCIQKGTTANLSWHSDYPVFTRSWVSSALTGIHWESMSD